MVLIVRTKNLRINWFTSTHCRTIHRKSSNSYQIPSRKDYRPLTNQEIFNLAIVEYEDALKKSRYDVDLKYTNNKSEIPKAQKRNNMV